VRTFQKLFCSINCTTLLQEIHAINIFSVQNTDTITCLLKQQSAVFSGGGEYGSITPNRNDFFESKAMDASEFTIRLKKSQLPFDISDLLPLNSELLLSFTLQTTVLRQRGLNAR
jgi:hypothetical protein